MAELPTRLRDLLRDPTDDLMQAAGSIALSSVVGHLHRRGGAREVGRG